MIFRKLVSDGTDLKMLSVKCPEDSFLF